MNSVFFGFFENSKSILMDIITILKNGRMPISKTKLKSKEKLFLFIMSGEGYQATE